MKDTGVPASSEEVRGVIRNCLHQAALVNYSRVSEYASIESKPPFQGQNSYSRLGMTMYTL